MSNSEFIINTTDKIAVPVGTKVLVREGDEIGALKIRVMEKTQPIITAQHKQTKELIEIDVINFKEGLLLSDWQWYNLSEVDLIVN